MLMDNQNQIPTDQPGTIPEQPQQTAYTQTMQPMQTAQSIQPEPMQQPQFQTPIQPQQTPYQNQPMYPVAQTKKSPLIPILIGVIVLFVISAVGGTFFLLRAKDDTSKTSLTSTSPTNATTATQNNTQTSPDTPDEITADGLRKVTGNGYTISLPSYMEQDFTNSSSIIKVFSTSSSSDLSTPTFILGIQNFTGEGKTGTTAQIQEDLADQIIDKYLGDEGPAQSTLDVPGAKEEAYELLLKNSKYQEGAGVSSVTILVAARKSGGYVGISLLWPANITDKTQYEQDFTQIINSFVITD